jgi:U4/U6.U5 tri-snRNP component SNU23
MADKKAGAYGAKPGGGDTDFRKTYDREEYARRADERARREKEEGAARYQAKLEGKTYHRPRAGTPEDLKETTARSTRFDPTSMIGKTTLIAAGSGVGKKNKSLGIWCDVCELAFSVCPS